MEELDAICAKSLTNMADSANKGKADKICNILVGLTNELLVNAAKQGNYGVSIYSETQYKNFAELFKSSNYHDYLLKSYMDKFKNLGFKVDFQEGGIDIDPHIDIHFYDGRTMK